ncbi:MAG: IS66 family insertion sequence element accessory protein TnpB [Sphingobacteriales bacterium]|nr:IS66 family insertion sequence element accessory protein TnpB [Sphingobacteriales bacterium]
MFIGRRGNKIKLLQWDSDGFALYEKGLEQGTFERPPASHNGHFLHHLTAITIYFAGCNFKNGATKIRFTCQ